MILKNQFYLEGGINYNISMVFRSLSDNLIRMILVLTAGLFLFGCSGVSAEEKNEMVRSVVAEEKTEEKAEEKVKPTEKPTPEPQPTYQAPEFLESSFHQEGAQGYPGAYIDTSCVSQGYVAVSAVSNSRLKFQVLKDDETYNYNISKDGSPSVFPLQCGNGTYRFRIMENIVDKKYACVYETYVNVELADEFQPFLRPSDYVNYSRESKCVEKAAELALKAYNQVDMIKEVYHFICKTVKYDTPKAEGIQSGYLPTPDETMETGMGICFDYASLAASMLRSQGIPTKVIFGYVSLNDVYHAWNMFYTEETGWVTAEFSVDPNDWTRMDLTFSANGADSKFIGDGGNYSDVYEY